MAINPRASWHKKVLLFSALFADSNLLNGDFGEVRTFRLEFRRSKKRVWMVSHGAEAGRRTKLNARNICAIRLREVLVGSRWGVCKVEIALNVELLLHDGNGGMILRLPRLHKLATVDRHVSDELRSNWKLGIVFHYVDEPRICL